MPRAVTPVMSKCNTIYQEYSGLKKNLNCPLDKQLSAFACPRQVLVCSFCNLVGEDLLKPLDGTFFEPCTTCITVYAVRAFVKSRSQTLGLMEDDQFFFSISIRQRVNC